MLSGGERQTLSMCHTLTGDPSLMLVDEPTEGLLPWVVGRGGAGARGGPGGDAIQTEWLEA